MAVAHTLLSAYRGYYLCKARSKGLLSDAHTEGELGQGARRTLSSDPCFTTVVGTVPSHFLFGGNYRTSNPSSCHSYRKCIGQHWESLCIFVFCTSGIVSLDMAKTPTLVLGARAAAWYLMSRETRHSTVAVTNALLYFGLG